MACASWRRDGTTDTVHDEAARPGHRARRPLAGSHSPVQCAHPDRDFIYDHDPEFARRTRRLFLEAQCESGTLVLTAHFPSPSVGKVMPEGDAFRFHYS